MHQNAKPKFIGFRLNYLKTLKYQSLKVFSVPLIFSLIAFTATQVYAQEQYQIPIPKVIPPSPDAASLGKYGSTPVGLHTGIPNISIPLYTVKSGNLELPISISYHASGVKVNEIASWVGLGWSLNAGGVITRSVVGKSDEGGFWNMAVKNATQLTASDYVYMKAIANGEDGESDYYFYNFNNRSGKFIYKQNDSVTPFQIPQSPLNIKFLPNRFEILDEVGTKYIFGQVETAQLSDGSAETFNNAYYLTQMIAANGTDNIQLYYEVDGGYFDGALTDTEAIGLKCFNAELGAVCGNDRNISSSTSSRFVLPVRLRQITFATGKVDFVRATDRLDLSGNSRLTDIWVYNKNPDGSWPTSPVKRISLTTGYFGSNAYDFRLKLMEVVEKDILQNTVRKHGFTYNEVVTLPVRGSRAQDWWGFYNGQNFNTSLIPTETILVDGYQYNVGGGNREPSQNHMGAATLSKITYPTGGYTEFNYEPHYYSGGIVKSPQSRSASSGATGNTTDLLQQTVTFSVSTSGWAKVTTYCSDVTDADPFFSTVTLIRQNDRQSVLNHVYSPYTFTPYSSHLSKEYMVYLLAGSAYELKVMSKGHSTSPQFSGAAFSQATVDWSEESIGTSIMAGGLRIKTIKDYAGVGLIPIIREYKYGVGEVGTGSLLIPSYGINSSKRDIDWIFNEMVYDPVTRQYVRCDYATHAGTRKLVTSTAPVDLTSLNGAPVVYPEVAVYENSTSGPNGKQVFKFDVAVDEFTYAPKAYNNGTLQLNNSWRGGDEVWNASVKNGGTTVVEKFNNHVVLNSLQTTGTKIGYKVQMEGCATVISESILFTHLYYFDYPTYSGIKKQTKSKNISYSSVDPLKKIEQTEDYFYENLQSNHQQLTKKITTDSDGDQVMTKYWYPADYTATTSIGTTTIQTLLNANIIGKPIKTEKSRGVVITEGDVQTYNQYGDPVEIYRFESGTSPTHQNNVIVPTGYVKKADIMYDATSKRVNKVQLTNSISTGYLWNYNNSYPVAKVDNASPGDVAATSFEFDGKGNWNYTGATYNDIAVKTGSKYYKLTGGNITKSIAPGTYKLEYWAKSAVTLSGGTITSIRTSSPDSNGWILYEFKVTSSSTSTLSLSGTAVIDELRLYPMNAQITTYTYDVINGITSVNDPNNFISYYDYDTFGRLKWIRDYKSNIVKSIDYHYRGN